MNNHPIYQTKDTFLEYLSHAGYNLAKSIMNGEPNDDQQEYYDQQLSFQLQNLTHEVGRLSNLLDCLDVPSQNRNQYYNQNYNLNQSQYQSSPQNYYYHSHYNNESNPQYTFQPQNQFSHSQNYDYFNQYPQNYQSSYDNPLRFHQNLENYNSTGYFPNSNFNPYRTGNIDHRQYYHTNYPRRFPRRQFYSRQNFNQRKRNLDDYQMYFLLNLFQESNLLGYESNRCRSNENFTSSQIIRAVTYL